MTGNNRQVRTLGKFPGDNDETDLRSNSIEKGEGASATIDRVEKSLAKSQNLTLDEYRRKKESGF